MNEKAEDCQCVECDETAAGFWPCNHSDDACFSYCRICLDKRKNNYLAEKEMIDE